MKVQAAWAWLPLGSLQVGKAVKGRPARWSRIANQAPTTAILLSGLYIEYILIQFGCSGLVEGNEV